MGRDSECHPAARCAGLSLLPSKATCQRPDRNHQDHFEFEQFIDALVPDYRQRFLCLYPLPGKEGGLYRPVHVVLLDSPVRLGIRYAGDDFDDRRFNREVFRFRVFVNPV